MADSRAAVVKLLKARGAKARRGHLRFGVGELFWYVDLRLDGVGPRATSVLEVGCWTPLLPPEPDGGAVDCPLLVDVPLASVAADAEALVDRVLGIDSLDALRSAVGAWPDALVDRALRDLLESLRAGRGGCAATVKRPPRRSCPDLGKFVESPSSIVRTGVL